MKFYVAIASVLVCLQGTSSLFYGANTGLSQSKTLSSAINKCSTANDQIKSDICKVVKTTIKFDNEKYKKASNALTDIEYTFQAMSGFYNNFLNCLNDQNETTSGVVTIRNLEILLYQLDIYVLTGIEAKFAVAAEVLGDVFGAKRKDFFNQIASQFASEFNIIKTSISELRDSFQSIVESGNAITIESINATLSDTSFNNMITAFKDIEVTVKQSSSVVSNFVTITTTLDKVTTTVSTSQSASTTMITKGNYNMDIAVQASKKLFASKTLTLQNDVEDSFSEFQVLTAEQFSGGDEIFEVRALAEKFVINIKAVFESSSAEFKNFFSERFVETSKDITVLKQSVSECTKRVTDFIADSVAENSGSFSRCFDQTEFSQGAKLLVESLGINSSLCIAQQTNTSLTAQSLLSFIAEDTVLSVKTHADRFCACSVKGDKKTEEKSKRCLKKRAEECEKILQEEKEYIETERANVFKTVMTSSETFKTCSLNVVEIFNASFEKYQKSLKSCLAF